MLVEVEAAKFKNAYDIALVKFNSLLSMLVFFYTRPIQISSIRIYDNKYSNLIYATRSYCPRPEKLIAPEGAFSKEVPIGSLLALYREGMNSLDLAYRYISFFKIYEAWYKKQFSFELTDHILHEKGVIRKKLTINEDSFEYLYQQKDEKIEKFLGKVFDDEDLFTNLLHLRNLLTHYMLDRIKVIGPHFFNLDDPLVYQYVELMANMIEKMVTYILIEEFNLLAKFDEGFNRLFSPDKHLCKEND
jgi:hypothetical protein